MRVLACLVLATRLAAADADGLAALAQLRARPALPCWVDLPEQARMGSLRVDAWWPAGPHAEDGVVLLTWEPELIAGYRLLPEDRYPDLDLARLLPDEGWPPRPDAGVGGRQILHLAADGSIGVVYARAIADLDDDGIAETVDLRAALRAGDAPRLRIRRHPAGSEVDALDLLCPVPDTWSVRVRAFSDGPRVEIGPATQEDLQAVLRVRWDPVVGDWRWEGVAGCHRLADHGDDAVRAALAGLPPPAVAPPRPSLEERLAAALASPAGAAALADRDPAEAAALRDPQRVRAALEHERLGRPRLPERCWALPPVEAALVFARANRRRSDEAAAPLRAGAPAEAPRSLVLTTWCTAHGRDGACWRGVRALQMVGEEGLLVMARRSRGWSIRPEDDHASRTFVVRTVDAATTRHAIAVAHGLADLGDAAGGGEHLSTTDSTTALLTIDGTDRWAPERLSHALAESWSGGIDDQARLGLVALWLGRALDAHLGLPDDADAAGGAEAVLAHWRAGRLPPEAALIAAEELAERDPARLLAEVPADAPFADPLAAARRRLPLIADAAGMGAAARAAGPDRMWARRRLVLTDRAQAIAIMTAIAEAETDQRRRERWQGWIRDLQRER